MTKPFVMGQIIGAHGVRGELRVYPFTDDPLHFSRLKTCLLGREGSDETSEVQILQARLHGRILLLRLKGIDSREAAEAQRGALLKIERAAALPLEPDTWFVEDLLGCRVQDLSHGDLGVVSQIQTGLHQDLYTVTAAGQADLYFPAVKQFLKSVDLEQRLITVDLPDGLVELYRPV